MTDTLRIDVDGHVATLTLDRPDRLNALDLELVEALHDALRELQADEGTRAVVLAGAGRAFCAGADVSRLMDMAGQAGRALTSAEVRRQMEPSARLAAMVATFDKPLVAAVHGVAAGAGASIAIACDAVVMGPAGSITFVFPRRGLVPDYGATWLLPRLVGMRTARRLLLTGERVDAAEALALGLASEVAEDVPAAARARAEAFAAGPGLATGMTKRLLLESFQHDLATAIDREFTMQALAFSTADAAEGARSFVEKRPPEFTWR